MTHLNQSADWPIIPVHVSADKQLTKHEAREMY